MLKLLTVATLAVTMTVPLAAQSDEREAVERAGIESVLTTLFDGMRTRDTAAMRSVFEPNASMQSLRADGVGFDSIEGWLKGVADAPADLVLDERLGDRVIQIDSNLASVWVDYTFYIGDRISHCGVNSIQLAKRGDSWRIFSVVDTRHREGCSPR